MKLENNWKHKTLDSLEKRNTPIVDEFAENSLVNTCQKLRRKQLKEFTIENLRVMIGQNIGLNYLIPLAIEKLEANILAEGDFYEGDLLKAVLRSDEAYWRKEKSNLKEVCDFFQSKFDLLTDFDTTKSIKQSWFDSYENFRVIHINAS